MNTTWTHDIRKIAYPALRGKHAADVVILGGGLAGITTAYRLAKSGKKVIVLEANSLGSNATLRTTAFLTHNIDTSLVDLVSIFGSRKAKEIWQSHAAAIDSIEELIVEEKISCEFTRCSALIYASNEKQFKEIAEDYRIAKHMGFPVSLETTGLDVPSFGYMELRNQAKFHPGKFFTQLAKKADEAGVQIFEHSEVIALEGENMVIAKTKSGEVEALEVVIATYNPFGNPRPTHFKKGMYTSYVLEAKIPTRTFSENLYWDYSNPYYYFRIDRGTNGYDRMIIGGEDHRHEIPINEEKAFSALEEYLKSILGSVSYTIVRRWSGPILEPSDGLALIGRLKPHHYVASAFSGNGMTYSIIAGWVLRDLILKEANPWAKLYDPARSLTGKSLLTKGRDYTAEFVGGALKLLFKKTANK